VVESFSALSFFFDDSAVVSHLGEDAAYFIDAWDRADEGEGVSDGVDELGFVWV